MYKYSLTEVAFLNRTYLYRVMKGHTLTQASTRDLIIPGMGEFVPKKPVERFFSCTRQVTF